MNLNLLGCLFKYGESDRYDKPVRIRIDKIKPLEHELDLD